MNDQSRVTRIVMVVFDGLRPDVVTPDRMPALSAFLGEARRYTRASSVFPSITRVCASAIGTGAPSAVHGIVQNAFPDRAVRGDRLLDTARPDDLRAAVAAHGPGFVATPRFADALAAAGKRLAIVHTGSAGGAFLLDPRAQANGSWVFSVHGRAATETPAAWDSAVARLGPPPAKSLPQADMMDYGARVLTEVALPEAQPDIAVLWLNEPDTSFHYLGLDGPGTRAALAASDAAFARVLEAVRAAPDGGAQTAVLAVSDHGHIAVTERLPLAEHLGEAGFGVALGTLHDDLTVYPGTACCFWQREPDAARLQRLVAFLREQPWCGPLFTLGGNGVEGAVPGSFDLALLGAAHPHAPAVVAQLRSSEAPDPYGLPGVSLIAGTDLPLGGGMHGGLNRAEMANLIALRLPGRAAGETEARPVSLIDLAPTMLGLLGLPPLPSMVGHDMLGAPAARPERLLETGAGQYRQALHLFGEGPAAVLHRAWRNA
ncbi:MAG TPA: alkaline phosphatase family protein [Roseomonas sp.]